MRDSRIGSFGVIGIVLILLVKYVSLDNIPASLTISTLVLMTVTGRWTITYAIFVYPYARSSGLGKAFKEGAGWLGFALATIVTIAVAVILMNLAGLVILLLVWIVTVVLAAYFKKTFAGLTGDNYGAVNEITEVSVLILVNLFVHMGFL